MFTLLCEKCKGNIFPDEQATLEKFLSKVDYVRDDLDNICDIAINNFIIYKCDYCGATYELQLRDVERKLREKIAHDVKAVRKIYVMRNDIPIGSVDPDNGMEYCGLCVGVDNEGNCYKDIIKQCSFRR